MKFYSKNKLIGLEIWHGCANNCRLFDLRENKEKYFIGLKNFLLELQKGTAETASPEDTKALKSAVGFTHLICCGGEVENKIFRELFSADDLPFSVDFGDTVFCSTAGAAAIFDEYKINNGITLDLGQSQLKIITPEKSCTLSRDEKILPFGRNALPAHLGREYLRNFLQEGMSIGVDILGRQPDGWLLGLPVSISAGGFADSSTYPGLYGDIEELFSDLFQEEVIVINDAVLCARGYLPTRGMKQLVITLGFGVGAALWNA